MSVYGIGYHQGVIDDARNPGETRGAILDDLLAGLDANRRNLDVLTDSQLERAEAASAAAVGMLHSLLFGLRADPSAHARLNPRTRKVASIGRDVVRAARRLARDELERVAERIKTDLLKDREKTKTTTTNTTKTITMAEFLDAASKDEEFLRWKRAVRTMEGEWKYLLVETSVPNAFVAEVCPNCIFVTTSMLERIVHNDDELALILGHEVSHLLLGHLSESNTAETMLRTVEVLLLSMDPTEGILSLGIVGGLAALRIAMSASHSRDNEREADDLGIRIAAMACYNTRRGANVFRTLQRVEEGGDDHDHDHDVEKESTSSSSQSSSSSQQQQQQQQQQKQQPHRRLLQFADSHPPSQERYEHLLKSSEEENADKYCATVKRRMGGILR